MKKILVFLIAFMVACSGVQRTLPAGPNVTVVDAGPDPTIDQDAYNITLPPVEDVAIRLNVVDGAGPNGEIIAPLRAGQPAPFNGVLFNGPAVARVEVEFRGQAAQCRIDRQADIDRMAALARRDIGLLTVRLDSQRQSYQLMINSRDRELTRLFTYIRENNNPPINPWPMIGVSLGAFVLGGGIMTGILLAPR